MGLRDVTFKVDRGTSFGLLGSEGAGKSALLRILATLQRPTQGRVTIDGLDVVSHRTRVRQVVGYRAKSPTLHRHLTVHKHLRFWALVDGLSRAERTPRIADLVENLGLAEVVDDLVIDCSASIQSRVFLAQSLLSDPKVLLLDEPMIGLPLAERESFAQTLMELQKEGKTIVLSTARVEDVDLACKELVVMAQGRATVVFQTADLLHSIGAGHHARIFVEGEAVSAEVVAALSQLSGVLGHQQTGGSLILFVDPRSVKPPQVRKTLEQSGVEGAQVKAAEITLGDVFRALSQWEES